MRTDSISGARPFYTNETFKNTAKDAAVSAVLSAGVTLAINKGNPKNAAKIGGLAAGISVVFSFIRNAIDKNKAKKETAIAENYNNGLCTHQG